MPAEKTIHSLDARVSANRALGGEYWKLTLEAAQIARMFHEGRAKPGQFVNVGFPDITDPLLARPFAVFDARAGEVDVLFKKVGRGTVLMAELSVGDGVRLVGPLGRPWRLEPAEASVLVAGGTGWGALHMLGKALASEGREVRAIWGQCDADAFPAERLVEAGAIAAGEGAPDAGTILSTDDGSCGFCGSAVECLRDLLENKLAGRSLALYGAGPVAMLRALAELARERGLPCQVSLEARMACGIGVCRGCVVNARGPHPETGLRRRTVCTDGPVFDAAEIDWENVQ